MSDVAMGERAQPAEQDSAKEDIFGFVGAEMSKAGAERTRMPGCVSIPLQANK